MTEDIQEEYTAATIRLERIDSFMNSNSYKIMDWHDKFLVGIQRDAIFKYQSVLRQRLERLAMVQNTQ